MNQQQQSGKRGESKPFKKTSGKSNKKSESSQAKLWEKTNFSQTTKTFGCFICIEPHRARDCPKKENLNALIGVEEDHSNGFYQRAKVALLPHLNGMLIMDKTQPCYVQGLNKPPKKPSKEETISTL
ncbi:hypothetical protein AAG906_020674 [Vitis piasezkii]